MKRTPRIAAGCIAAGLAVLWAAPVLASPCADEIAALSKRVEGESREAIAASTSGKGEAAAREGQGTAGAAGGAASGKPPGTAAEAGKGAEKAQAAKVALDEARTADGKGDAKGCDEAVARARKNLDQAP